MLRYAMEKEIAINKPLSGLGWRVNIFKNKIHGKLWLIDGHF